jgi:hypothetical protein
VEGPETSRGSASSGHLVTSAVKGPGSCARNAAVACGSSTDRRFPYCAANAEASATLASLEERRPRTNPYVSLALLLWPRPRQALKHRGVTSRRDHDLLHHPRQRSAKTAAHKGRQPSHGLRLPLGLRRPSIPANLAGCALASVCAAPKERLSGRLLPIILALPLCLMSYENSQGGGQGKKKWPRHCRQTPEARTTGRDLLWSSPLSCTQPKNPPRKRRRLGAPIAASGSRAASFARSDRRKLPGASRYARRRRFVGLALVDIGCFDAQRVCNALLGGGAGLRRANSGVVGALGQLLSYS